MAEDEATERIDALTAEPLDVRAVAPSLFPTLTPSTSPPPVVLRGPGLPSVPGGGASAPPSASSSSSLASASSASPSGARPASTVAASTLDAMHGEEATRAAGFGRVVAILCLVGLIGQLGYQGHPKLRIAMAAAHSILGAVAAWVWWRARDPARWSPAVFRIFGVTSAMSSVVSIHYLGVFSPVTVVVVMGLSFFGLGEDSKIVVPVSIVVAFQYMGSALLITLGIVPDLGLFVPASVPQPAKLAMLGIVTATMFMVLWQARLGRRATLEAIERSNEAVRLARTREAKLEEAKENLDAAIRAGSGKSGRYTGTSAGRFRLEHIVGRGAMGEVYSARVGESSDRVAVKLLHLGKLEEPELVSRFLREAEVARRVRGPNLVDMIEVGNARRIAVHRHGAARGERPRDAAPRPPQPCARRGGDARRRCRPWSRDPARRRRRAPRSQAGEPVPLAGPAAPVEDPRLRRVEAPRVDDDRRPGGRNAGLHVPRASPGR